MKVSCGQRDVTDMLRGIAELSSGITVKKFVIKRKFDTDKCDAKNISSQ